MTSEFLIKLWNRRAVQGDLGAKEKLQELGLFVTPEKILSTGGKLIYKPITSKSGDRTRTFRGNTEVELILNQIKEGNVSRFINRAILFYVKRDKESIY